MYAINDFRKPITDGKNMEKHDIYQANWDKLNFAYENECYFEVIVLVANFLEDRLCSFFKYCDEEQLKKLLDYFNNKQKGRIISPTIGQKIGVIESLMKEDSILKELLEDDIKILKDLSSDRNVIIHNLIDNPIQTQELKDIVDNFIAYVKILGNKTQKYKKEREKLEKVAQ